MRLKKFLLFSRTIIILCLLLSPLISWADEEIPAKHKLSLKECVEIALNNHPKIKVYTQRALQGEEQYNETGLLRLPTVGLSASYDRLSYISPQKKNFIGDSRNDYQANLNVKLPLLTGGAISAQQEMSKYSLKADEKNLESARNEVVLGVKSAYYKLSFARQMVQAKKDLLAQMKDFLDIAVDLNRRTKMPREETLLRIEVQLNNTQQELLTARTNLEIARQVLENALGVRFDEQTDFSTDDISLIPGQKLNLADCFTKALNNPLVKKIEDDLNKAKSGIKFAQSDYYPRLSLLGAYGYEWSNLEGERKWSLGLISDLLLFDWGKTKSKVRQAEAYLKEIEITKILIEQQIYLEVKSAFLKVSSTQERIEIAKSTLDKAEKSFSIFQQRYKDTTANSVEVLDAYQAKAQSEINYWQTILDYHLSLSELYYLTGKD
jgi:outer membrane protein TolC